MLIAIAMGLAAAAACAKPPANVPPVAGTPPREPVVSRAPGPMRPIVATKMGAKLTALGLDPRNLPPIEQIDLPRKRKLMKTFSDSLGVPCVGCHADGDFAADTRRKRVAKRMWNEMVRVLSLESGDPVYCDSCHQGAMVMLDRRDKGKVSDFMSDVFVGNMKRVDGRDHDCGTCHGDPPDFKFLSAWKDEPAPDLDPPAPLAIVAIAPASPPPPSASAVATAPTSGQAAPRKAAASVKIALDCGDKTNLCPLQVWMRKNVATAVAANDAAALARALDRVATFSPDASWTWTDMSKKAADAARRGDMTEARKSCQGCHNAYKAAWRDKYRTRPVQ